jgi:hypothetical protein
MDPELGFWYRTTSGNRDVLRLTVETVEKVLKRVAEIDLGCWARQARGAQAQSNLCPKGLDRNDHGAVFHSKEIAQQGYPISDVPCGEGFSVQTTHSITF